jgi:carbonic anhydrase
MTQVSRLLAANQAYAAARANVADARPSRRLAVVTCMDARIDVFAALGLHLGEAHVIRNAGGIVTDDVIRSLALSQEALGTEEIMVIQHTGCMAPPFADEQFERLVREYAGPPEMALGTETELEERVRICMQRIRSSPMIPRTDKVRGFVYAVETGGLSEVT